MDRFNSTVLAVYGTLIALAMGSTPPAQVVSTPAQAVAPASASLAPCLVATPDGATAVLIRFRIEPHWHLYWSNPGDSGAPPAIKLTLPAGWTSGVTIFPRPEILGTAEERNFGYQDSLDLLIPVFGPKSDAPSIAVEAKVDWLVCKTSCIMGRATLSEQVSISPDPKAPQSRSRALPVKLPDSVRATLEGSPTQGSLVLSGATKSFGTLPVSFIPDPMSGVEYLDGTGPYLSRQVGDVTTIRVPFSIEPKDAVDGPPRLRGLVLTGKRDVDPAFQVDLKPSDVSAVEK